MIILIHFFFTQSRWYACTAVKERTIPTSVYFKQQGKHWHFSAYINLSLYSSLNLHMYAYRSSPSQVNAIKGSVESSPLDRRTPEKWFVFFIEKWTSCSQSVLTGSYWKPGDGHIVEAKSARQRLVTYLLHSLCLHSIHIQQTMVCWTQPFRCRRLRLLTAR